MERPGITPLTIVRDSSVTVKRLLTNTAAAIITEISNPSRPIVVVSAHQTPDGHFLDPRDLDFDRIPF